MYVTLSPLLQVRAAAVREALKASAAADRDRERERVRERHRARKAKRKAAEAEAASLDAQVAVRVETVESRFGQKRGFGVTPGKLLTISKPNHCPKWVIPPGRKRVTKPNP